MRIFNLTLFLGVWFFAALLDFLFPIETNCCVAELSAAAIAAIAGGSALVSGVGNLLDSASTNKANREINQNTLDFQRQENEKSRKWQEKEFDRQFEKTSLYNSPSAQMERYRKAGLNPYLVNGQASSNGNTSVSTPSASSQSAPSQHPAMRSDYGFVSEAGRNTISLLNESRSVDANIANQQEQQVSQALDNAYKIGEKFNDWKAAHSYLNTRLREIKGSNYDAENSLQSRILRAKVAKDEADADFSRTVADLKALYGDKEIRSALQLQSLEGKKLKEEILSLAKDRSKTDVEISKIISEKIRNYAEANHINADTRTINATRDLLIEGMKHDNKVKQYDAETRGYEAGESSASFKQRRKARAYMVSPEGVDDALHNQVTRDNQAINRLDRIKDAINPLKMSGSK